MNLPNKITLARLALIPVFVALYLNLPQTHFLPALVFVFASATDFVDGHIARSRGLVTTFGKFADPLVDKVLTMSAFILLAEAGKIAGWIVIIIIARELIITGFRTIAASKGVTIAASMWGKYKTTFQMLSIIVLLFQEGLLQFMKQTPISTVLVGLATIFTILSGVDYIVKNRALLDPDDM